MKEKTGGKRGIREGGGGEKKIEASERGGGEKRPAVRTQKSLIPQNNKSAAITPCGPGASLLVGFSGMKSRGGNWRERSRFTI